jgi:WD40 repeat protein
MAVSPDGKRVAVDQPSGPPILVVEAPSGKSTPMDARIPGRILLMAFEPGARRLVALSEPVPEGVSPSARSLEELRKRMFQGNAFGMTPGSRGFELRVFDLNDGRLVWTAQGPTDAEPCGLAVSPDGARILVSDKTWALRKTSEGGFAWIPPRLHVFDGRTGKPLKVEGYPGFSDDTVGLGPNAAAVRLLASPDGKWLAATYGPSIRIYETRTGRQMTQLDGHRAGPDGLAFSPDSSRLVTAGGKDGTLKVWDVARSGRNPLVLPAAELRDSIKSAFRPDGKQIAVAGEEGEVRVYDVATGAEVTRIPSPKDQSDESLRNVDRLYPVPARLVATDLAYTADGRRLVAAYAKPIIATWDLTGGKPACVELLNVLALEAGHENEPRAWVRLRLSPDAEFLACWSCRGLDDHLSVWQLPGKRRVLSHDRQAGTRYTEPRILFSGDGQSVLITGVLREGKPVTLSWDMKTGQPAAQARADILEPGRVLPDGSRRLVVTDRGQIQLVERGTNRHLLTLTGRKRYVAAAFSPDGRRVAAATDDTVEVYDGSPPTRAADR